MIDSLYEPFKHWSETGTIWIYSDPHFSDEEMVHLRKNYIGDEEQIKRINSKVGKKDTLIILGDIGNIEMVKKLKGYKILIMGNHDSGASNYQRKFWEEETEDGRIVKKDNRLFDEVYDGPLFIEDKILLSHEPIDLPFTFNIHGHDHSGWSGKDERHLNLCAEWIDYTPFNFTSAIKKGLTSKVESIHRIIIDNATERKRRREGDER